MFYNVLLIFFFSNFLFAQNFTTITHADIENNNLPYYTDSTPLERVILFSELPITEAYAAEIFTIQEAAFNLMMTGSDNVFTFTTDDIDYSVRVEEFHGTPDVSNDFIVSYKRVGSNQEVYQYLSDKSLLEALGRTSSDMNEFSREQIISRFEEFGPRFSQHFIGSPYHFTNSSMLSEIGALLETPAFRNAEATGAIHRESAEILDEAHYIYHELIQEWERQRLDYGHLSDQEFLDDIVDKNMVKIETPYGVGELNSIDGKFFVRVVHDETELAFYFMKNFFEDFEGTDHFNLYIARQHIMAGQSRRDNQTGRDGIIMNVDNYDSSINPEHLVDPDRFIESNRISPNSYMERTLSLRWWGEYGRAIWQKPASGSLSFGIVCGAVQYGLVFATKLAIDAYTGFATGESMELMQMMSNANTPALFTAGWGAVFGVMNSTWRNLVYTGTDLSRTVKKMANGLTFSIIVTQLLSQGSAFVFNSSADVAMSALQFSLLISASYISNRSKVNWDNMAKIMEVRGDTRRNWTVPGTKIQWRLTNVANQIAYLPAFTFRLIDRGFAALGFGFLGQTALVLSIPISEFVNMNFSKARARFTQNPDVHRMANRAEALWKQKIAMYTDPGVMGYIYLKMFGSETEKLAATQYLNTKYSEVFQLNSVEERRELGERIRSFKVPDKSCVSLIDRAANTMTNRTL